MTYFLYLNKSRSIVITAPGSKLSEVLDAFQKVWKKSSLAVPKWVTYSVQDIIAPFTSCCTLEKEHFRVIVNVLWISKDTIYSNTARIPDLLGLTFVSLVSVSHWCVYINLSKLQCQWKVSCVLCVYLRDTYHLQEAAGGHLQSASHHWL